MTRAERILPLAAMAFLLAPGCGPTGEVAEPPPPPPVVVQREDTTRVVFRSRTDTVAVQPRTVRPGPATDGGVPKIRFMVQIGAFKDPHLATAVQVRARERYRMPVLNDYIIQHGLYQIRIGFFETRAAAQDFRTKLARDYPGDYGDSWVVQLQR